VAISFKILSNTFCRKNLGAPSISPSKSKYFHKPLIQNYTATIDVTYNSITKQALRELLWQLY
jgi:hypothetical protein